MNLNQVHNHLNTGIFSLLGGIRTFAIKAKSLPPRKVYLANVYQRVLAHRTLLVFQANNLNSREWLALRKKFNQLTFMIPKNGVMRAVIEKSKYQNMRPLFDGPTAMAFNNGELAAFSPLLQYFKSEPRCFMLGAKVENSLLTTEDFEKALKLPGKKDLQGELLGLLQMPTVSMISTLQHTPQFLVMNLEHATKQKEGGAAPPADAPAA